ncbi:MAG: hypothetical protein Q7S12_01395 [bacterium]|nr:hypothetical protein [bacterium]
MEKEQKQGELIEKTAEEKKTVRQAPKPFKKYIRQLGIEEEEKKKVEKK